MTLKNPYRKSSHLGAPKSRQIIRCFAEDFTATQTSKLLGIRRSTINSRYDHIRQAVFWSCLATDKETRNGIIEIDSEENQMKTLKMSLMKDKSIMTIEERMKSFCVNSSWLFS